MSAPSTDRPSKDSIPGVGPSPWGALALFILLGGATIFGVVRLLYGGQAPGSTIDTGLTGPLPSSLSAPSSSPSALVPTTTAAPAASASPSVPLSPTVVVGPDAAAAPRSTVAGAATAKPPGTATVPVTPPPASSGSPWPEPREVPKDLGDPRNVDPPGIGEQPLPE